MSAKVWDDSSCPASPQNQLRLASLSSCHTGSRLCHELSGTFDSMLKHQPPSFHLTLPFSLFLPPLPNCVPPLCWPLLLLCPAGVG